MNYSVLKGAAYVLLQAPDMVIHNGTTQTTERTLHPDSEYLKAVPKHLRSFEDCVNYLPNQIYIGNEVPEKLREVPEPWHENLLNGADRHGAKGEILPQSELIGMMKVADVFELVFLTPEFTSQVKKEFEEHPLIKEDLIKRLGEGTELSEIESLINDHGAEAIMNEDKIVGCVKRAHDVDQNLSAHVMFENLVVKASGIFAALNCIEKNNIDPESIEYVIECSEEACGDMNQRGGGNFAKSIAELTGLVNASGSDVRGFCAAPTHSLISAASLVQAGTFKNVMVVAGGSSAKLGMNGRDHVKKEMPIIEDCVAGFAFVVSQNDGEHPIIRTDIVGRHTVGTGSSPQAVITSLVTNPLTKAGLKIIDVDKYSVEMQNPDITRPAGAGDVPEANFKMIGALAVKNGEIERTALPDFIVEHGMKGWAPTQGHIPSGAPYLGFVIDDIKSGAVKRAMIIGKGSLFLGRMTNLFDGVSIVIEKNPGKVSEESAASEETIKKYVADAMRDFAKSFTEEN